MTELQKHVSFFDLDKDGMITVTETTQGDYILCCPCRHIYN